MIRHIWYILLGEESSKWNKTIGVSNDRFIIEIITINPKDDEITKQSAIFGRRCSTLYLDAALEAIDKHFVNECVKPCCCIGEKEIILI